jgi:hypothetical protein
MKKNILIPLILLLFTALSIPTSQAASTKVSNLQKLENSGVISQALREQISTQTHQLVLKAYLANLNKTVKPMVDSGQVTKLQTQYYFTGYNSQLNESQMKALKKLIVANPLKVKPVEASYFQNLYKEKRITKKQLTALLKISPINSGSYILY